MPKNPSGHNIYSGSKSKMVFQSPDDNLDKFDYINKVEDEADDPNSNSNSKSDSDPTPYSNLSRVGTQLCVQIMNKIAKIIKKMLKPKSGQDPDKDNDF